MVEEAARAWKLPRVLGFVGRCCEDGCRVLQREGGEKEKLHLLRQTQC